jgi:hypothetical protein
MAVKLLLDGAYARIEVLIEGTTCRLLSSDPPMPAKVYEMCHDPATFFQVCLRG